MKTRNLSIIFCFLMVFSVVLAAPTNADDKNKKTVITVAEPMRIPGATLQPGKYVLKLMDSLSDRHIVRVTNEDETQVIATILAIPNYRLEPTGETEFQMWEVPAGQPAALRAWFYPGDNFGQEFAYPKHVAVQIAENVPTISDEMEARLAAQTKVEDPISEEFRTTTITPAQQAQAATPAETPEERAAREERERLERERLEAERLERERAEAAAAAQAQQQAVPQQPAQQPMEQEPVEELPDTGSPFPLIGLVGLLSLGASAAIRFARR